MSKPTALRFIIRWCSVHLQCRRLHDAQYVAHAMLVSPNVWPIVPLKPPTGANKKNIRAIWKLILERVVTQGGPFAGIPKSDKVEKLVRVQCSIIMGLIDPLSGSTRIQP